MNCEQLVLVAEFLLDNVPAPGRCADVRCLNETCDVIDCCLQEGRNDLVPTLIQIVESESLGQHGTVAERLAIQKRQLSGQVPKPSARPPLTVRGWNFAKAMTRWAAGGFQMRSAAEIEERLAICQACPDLVNDHCNRCGCACVETEQLMNKLALKTERCPIGKWN